jgi:fumarate reductase subunit D
VEYSNGENLKKRLLLAITKINLQLEEFSEQQLDLHRLPHPLLGKISIREMMYFTMYHAEHHMEKAKENLRYVGLVGK